MRKLCAIVCVLLGIALALPSPASWAVEKKPKKSTATKPPRKPPAPAAKSVTPVPKKAAEAAQPLQVNAKAAVLLELSTGKVLFEQDPDREIEPASFTKILTLYLIFDALRQGQVKLTDEIFVSERAWRTGGSRMFVGNGTKVPLEDIVKGIAVVSGNDACVAAAEHLFGSVEAFVTAMNAKAKDLGMTRSHFANPHGLPDDSQITTARDMATLATAYIRTFPEALKYHSMKEFAYNGITQPNRNHLLWKDDSVDGLKTGYVAAAGYHLATTAQREGMRLVAVVMGAPTPAVRERECQALLNMGFRGYALAQPVALDKPVATVKVWKGLADTLELVAAEPPTILVPRPQLKSVKVQVNAPQDVTAPVTARQPLGDVVVSLGDALQKKVALVAKEAVPEGPFFKRVWHTILQVQTGNWILGTGVVAGVFVLAGGLMWVLGRRRRGGHRTGE